MKWLQSLEAIVIDRQRCPETAKEFMAYCYEDGRYPDRDNHHIDAVRYATGHLWRVKVVDERAINDRLYGERRKAGDQ